MRNPVRLSVGMLLLAGSLSTAPLLAGRASAQAGGEVLTNESVISMVNGKVPKDLITTKIRTTKATFDLTPSGLIGLNTAKVPSDLVKMMMTSTGSSAGAAKETLNNDAVVQMVNGGLPKDIIVQKIQMSRPSYDLTTNGIISLNQNKVSQDVVKAMMAAASGAPAPVPAKKP